MTRLIRAVVDSGALQANLSVVRRLAPRSKVMAVVKANAYGHGLVPTALALPGADAFAVARLEEGLVLRNAGVRTPIVLLEGVFNYAQLEEAAQHHFDLVVHTREQLKLLESWRGAQRFAVWLKMDSGMNRLGFRADQFAAAYAALASSSAVAPNIRLLTHLANADELGDATTREQLALFEHSIAPMRAASNAAGKRLELSIANSAGVLGWPDSHGDWVRPGLMLYGVSALAGRSAAEHGLKPVMTLYSTVIAVRDVPVGERVGYGGHWTAQRRSRIAIVAAGYGDGYPRHIPGGTPVLVNGQRAGTAGNVSMDMIGVDVTDLPPVQTGDPVVLWGEGLPAETVAPFAETIPYELLCGVSQRVMLELK